MNPDGGIVEIEAPIHVSNVMIVRSKERKAVTRVGYKYVDGQKVRFAKKSGEVLIKKFKQKREGRPRMNRLQAKI